jgi:hypothetical protein
VAASDVDKVIKVIESNKPWLWESRAMARDNKPMSFCQMKKAIKVAGLAYSPAFYNELRAACIDYFHTS